MVLHLAAGYIYFQERIPNGNRVPNPCKPGEIWNGVGHKLEDGSGARNPFGLDFKAAGLVRLKRIFYNKIDCFYVNFRMNCLLGM